MKKTIKIGIVVGLSAVCFGCLPTQPKMQMTNEYVKFADCPSSTCLASANDKYVAVGWFGWGKKIDVYSAENFEKIDSLTDAEILEAKYDLNSGTEVSPNFVGKIENGTANFRLRGEQKNYNLKVPGNYSEILSVAKIADSRIAIAFHEKGDVGIYYYDLGNPSAQGNKIYSLGIPYESVGQAIGKAILSVMFNRPDKTWHPRSSLAYSPNSQKIYFGLSNHLSESTSNAFKWTDAKSWLFVFDEKGNLLGEDKRALGPQYIDYGRIRESNGELLVNNSFAANYTAKYLMVNPETSFTKEIENAAHVNAYNNKHIFYSPDSKQFYFKKL